MHVPRSRAPKIASTDDAGPLLRRAPSIPVGSGAPKRAMTLSHKGAGLKGPAGIAAGSPLVAGAPKPP